ncbi:MAG: VUT family protein [Beijerinckiaceae bacterium]|nr:VUT family protein [Beijerinckiaceae bacterium]MCZ8300830.1 VUT family protein [Beijerinckiaceae bacterium]
MTDRDSLRRREGALFLVAFAACVPLANWLIQNVGTFCVPNGPCLVPVAPGITAPSGVLMIGVALVLRDLVQRRLGLGWAIGAILAGGMLSAMLSPPALVIASVTAFLLSELADLAVFTPLQKRGLVLAALASSAVGLVIDSLVFLWLAFGSLKYLEGQILGKALMVMAALPFLLWLRERDRRIGLEPA